MTKFIKYVFPLHKNLYIGFILFLPSILSLKAMEEEPQAQTHRSRSAPLHIVSPEGAQIVQDLRLAASSCPKVAQMSPIVESQQEFNDAKHYLNLMKKYDGFLYAAALAGIRIEIIEESQRLLSGLETYIGILLSAPCRMFRSEEDDGAIQSDLHEIHYRTAQNHLMLLIAALSGSNSQQNWERAKKHVEKIKGIKKDLSASSKYSKLLQEQIQTTLELVPVLKGFFHPGADPQPSSSQRRSSRKIAKLKKVNRYQKMCQLASGTEGEALKESYDIYFQLTSQRMMTDVLTLSSKKNVSSEEYVHVLQKLAADFRALESEGVRFRAKLLSLPIPSELYKLSLEDLTELYKFICQRNTLPHKNPLQVLKTGIFILIHANQLEDALIHTESLKSLLLEQGPLTENFISLRASVMALNGNFGEWKELLERRKQATAEIKATAHQKKVENIKQQLEQLRISQEDKESTKELGPPQSIQEARKSLPSDTSYEYAFLAQPKNYKCEIAPVRKKVKTHKLPQEHPINPMDSNSDKEPLNAPTATPERPQKSYALSNNAFRVYRKIRGGDRKFSRKDLYNLFEKLGCVIEVNQGKGDHGKIAPPLNMTITNEEGFVAVIPEFTQKWKADDVPLPLTVPNWDEKWDGRVPMYMMKSIVQALDYLGASDNTVHK